MNKSILIIGVIIAVLVIDYINPVVSLPYMRPNKYLGC